MKKLGILNSEIARVLAAMGHTDMLCIGDCGLPIPRETERIDVSITVGAPSFIDVLKAITADMAVEAITLAEEIKEANPSVEEAILTILPHCKVRYVSHEAFKQETRQCKAVVRTGEATPYANIILHSGVIF